MVVDAGRQGPRAALVVLAAGSGSRTGGARNKVLVEAAGLPLLVWSLRASEAAGWCARTVVVARAEELDEVRAVLAVHAPGRDAVVVAGGPTRHASEEAALAVLADDVAAGRLDVVAIHDAARPLASPALYEQVVAAAARHGAALPVLRRRDVLLAGRVAPDVASVQTPQAFAAAPLLAAYARAAVEGFTGTDTAACVERWTDLAVVGVPGDPRNLKVTFAADLVVADRLLSRSR